ncbi:hypothetical protein, partial [Sinorhizobium meliloti]|uniref:hypothetical protein n=1 Tax=Rhizobium meliloti TaxID=382 RepID=UPI001AEC785F
VVILVVSNVAKRQPHENNLNSSMKQGGSARRDTSRGSLRALQDILHHLSRDDLELRRRFQA